MSYPYTPQDKARRDRMVSLMGRGLCTNCLQPVAPKDANLNGTCPLCISEWRRRMAEQAQQAIDYEVERILQMSIMGGASGQA